MSCPRWEQSSWHETLAWRQSAVNLPQFPHVSSPTSSRTAHGVHNYSLLQSQPTSLIKLWHCGTQNCCQIKPHSTSVFLYACVQMFCLIDNYSSFQAKPLKQHSIKPFMNPCLHHINQCLFYAASETHSIHSTLTPVSLCWQTTQTQIPTGINRLSWIQVPSKK